ncbi:MULTISPECIES: hypothetical protein [Burkholderia]|uniref:hypothetical protein n=1 Tax=Burkholderia TaxID=32008 RepID=UPI0012BC7BC9|nr:MULTISPECIES: hypothetical protein [Burkholderia]
MATANSTGRARPAREITGLHVVPGESSAPSDDEAKTPVNLASLPRKEALKCARIAGRQILGDGDALQPVADTIWIEWLNANAPIAVGQSDNEFGELIDAMGNEFFAGMAEGCELFQSIGQPQDGDRALGRAEGFLVKESALAWKLHNVLAFMVEAVPSDAPDGLPVQCMLADLRNDMDELATRLQGLAHRTRDAEETDRE